MSTSPEKLRRPEDEIISLLSHWLARHLDTPELRRRLDEVDTAKLTADDCEVLDELREDLDRDQPRARLEPAVREAVEALALGL